MIDLARLEDLVMRLHTWVEQSTPGDQDDDELLTLEALESWLRLLKGDWLKEWVCVEQRPDGTVVGVAGAPGSRDLCYFRGVMNHFPMCGEKVLVPIGDTWGSEG